MTVARNCLADTNASNEPSNLEGPWTKEKLGFWCPTSLLLAMDQLIQDGVYADRSKACVGLIRKGLSGKTMPCDLQAQLDKLAQFLDRDSQIVSMQCIAAVLEMVSSDTAKTPLIVEEVRLRQKHLQENKVREKASLEKPSRK